MDWSDEMLIRSWECHLVFISELQSNEWIKRNNYIRVSL